MASFEIKYEFVPSKENENRLSQAYDMVFDEIEDMLIHKEEDENKKKFKRN